MPNQNPGDITGANAMGRWDYGPWFWPPYTGLAHGPIHEPATTIRSTRPGEPPTVPARRPRPLVPEAFMDTPVVNGTAYPYLQGRAARRTGSGS